MTSYSSREFNQDAGKAKRASLNGPVYITDRGSPAHVLLSFEAYKKLTGGHVKMTDLLAMPGLQDIELEIPPRTELARGADFG